ncbi:MAG TPA: hypothetical protein VGE00_06090 [Gammaproteobacteria bacterium]
MKRIFVIAVAVGVGLWWNLVGGRTITEANVHDYYRSQIEATLQRQPEGLCDLLSEEFQLDMKIFTSRGTMQVSRNKQEMCHDFTRTYAAIQDFGDRMGGIAQLDYSLHTDDIQIADDRKSVTIEASYTFDVAGSRMTGTTTDTLIRRNGKTLLLRRTGVESMKGGA